MPAAPNERLAGLVAVLGEADVRELVQLFLDSYPALLGDLTGGDRARSHRAAHSLKSSAQQMGVSALAERARQLEQRLAQPDGAVTPTDVEQITADFTAAEGPLRAFAGPGQASCP